MSDEIPTPLVWLLMIATFIFGVISGLGVRKSDQGTICDHHYKLKADYETCMNGKVPKGNKE
jgi:hypothetical protein